MSTLEFGLIPYAEKVVSDYLRDDPTIESIGARVMGGVPRSDATPWIRVTQLDASNQANSTPEHLVNFLMQFDCYAGDHGGQPEAALLARSVRAALHVMPNAAVYGVVVTAVRFISMPRIPDTEYEPARERFVLTAEIYMHNQ